MKRRDFLKVSLAAGAAAGIAPALKGWVPVHNWNGYDFGSGPEVKEEVPLESRTPTGSTAAGASSLPSPESS